MPHQKPPSSRILKAPTDERDHKVLAFLKDGRKRAALKRLKHLGRAACATDVALVIAEVSHGGAFEQSRRLVTDVLDCVWPLHRLQPSHQETIRAALARHDFDHPAIAIAAVDAEARDFR